ncbi:MAG: type II toxin-antitoxin system RelE family toxin [Chthoniobacterales bacterium]
MSWRVELQRSAEKELKRLSAQNRGRIVETLRRLEAEAFPTGVKKLQNRDGYRVRVGYYRILYTVDHSAQVIRVSAIGDRKDVYR